MFCSKQQIVYACHYFVLSLFILQCNLEVIWVHPGFNGSCCWIFYFSVYRFVDHFCLYFYLFFIWSLHCLVPVQITPSDYRFPIFHLLLYVLMLSIVVKRLSLFQCFKKYTCQLINHNNKKIVKNVFLFQISLWNIFY